MSATYSVLLLNIHQKNWVKYVTAQLMLQHYSLTAITE
jgi:hypothetical protein